MTLKDVSISATNPFVCNSCSVSLWLFGMNSMKAGGNNSPGLACSSHGNITIYSQSGAFLNAFGGSFGSGIGGNEGSFCDLLSIHNSSIRAIGGSESAGIGSGGSSSIVSSSNISEIEILNCNIDAIGGYQGAGIGSRYSNGGNSIVSSVFIFESNISSNGNESTSIGSGSGFGFGGISTVGPVNIIYSSVNASGVTGI
jgi:hypothetical protein